MPNEEIREANIERVLETAFRCFLQHGIEQTTQTMLAEKTNITFRSINRYFKDKTDIVVQTAGWVGKYIRQLDGAAIDHMVATATEKTGIEILEDFLRNIERVYLDNPQLFALKGEFDIYIFRHGVSREEGYNVLWQNFNPHRMLTRTYEIGYADGTLKRFLEPPAEARYCCNSFFCFLQQLSIFERLTTEQAKIQIDTFIGRMVGLYKTKQNKR